MLYVANFKYIDFFLSFLLNQVASAVTASMGCTNDTGIACDGRCI